jgi:K+-sensing histidine kinase KdpD
VQELRAALASAAEETDRMARLAEDLLVLARLDQGKVGIADEELAVDELLRAIVHDVQQRARRQGLTGLAIVAVIVRSHGGDARAVNLACGGADVWIELATADAAAGAPRELSAARR